MTVQVKAGVAAGAATTGAMVAGLVSVAAGGPAHLAAFPAAYGQEQQPAAVSAAETVGAHLAASGHLLPQVRTAARVVRRSTPAGYEVVPGDTLSAIASRFCGSADRWHSLWSANQGIVRNPDLIFPGQHIKLACSAAVKAFTDVTRAVPVRSSGDGDADSDDRAATPARHVTAAVTGASGVLGAVAGHYSFAGLEALWEEAGGPAWAAPHAAEIAECESGGRTNAYNPSGASGLWQILGEVVPGPIFNPHVNALNAVSKFRASGDTFAQWVCQ